MYIVLAMILTVAIVVTFNLTVFPSLLVGIAFGIIGGKLQSDR